MPSRNEASNQIKSFIQGRVDTLLKRTYAQAQADVQQAAQEQSKNVAVAERD